MSPALPLLHDGDSFFIYLVEIGAKRVRIVRIVRFQDNQNAIGTEESWRDLDAETKRAIVQQINRRYVNKTVLT